MSAAERRISTQIPSLLVRPRAELAKRTVPPVPLRAPAPPAKVEPTENEDGDEIEAKSGTFLVLRDEK